MTFDPTFGVTFGMTFIGQFWITAATLPSFAT